MDCLCPIKSVLPPRGRREPGPPYTKVRGPGVEDIVTMSSCECPPCFLKIIAWMLILCIYQKTMQASSFPSLLGSSLVV